MLCECCKKNQATKIHEKDCGEKTEVGYYCFSCYDRLFTRAQNAPKTPAQNARVKTVEAKAEKTGVVCSVCGRTEEEFLASGLVGCADCYATLRAVLPTARKMQNASVLRHVGKEKLGSEGTAELVFRRNQMMGALEKKIAKKDFEGAKRCREDVQALNDLIYGGGEE